MKIYFLSDLHLENRSESITNLELYNDILHLDSNEYLALIGDLCRVFPESNLQKYFKFLQYCSKNYKTVFLIPGNNEYYNNVEYSITEINTILESLCAEFKNVIFLNNQTYDLDDNIRIVGSVLFNYTPTHKLNEALQFQNTCDNRRNDCRNTYINVKERKYLLSFRLKNILFKHNCKYLISEIRKAQITNKKLIICTHYPPSKKFLKDCTRAGSYNFYSNLDCLLVDPVLIWICGHSHYNRDFNVKDVICTMNTVGHSDEDTEFINGKHVNISYT